MIEIDNHVVSAFGDILSKEIYVERVRYSNGNNDSIEKIVSLVDGGKELIEFMNTHKENLYVFGAGIWGQELVKTWSWKYNFRAFIDNNRSLYGKNVIGLPVLPLEKVLQENKKTAIILATRLYWKEIEKQLRTQEINIDMVFNVGKVQSVLAENQYFDLPDINWEDGEVFVDVGAFDGNTSLSFCKWCTKKINKIYMFEPDEKNANKCKLNFEHKTVPHEIINKGVWSKTKECWFYSVGNGASCILVDGDLGRDNEESTKVDVVKMDEQLDRKQLYKQSYHP